MGRRTNSTLRHHLPMRPDLGQWEHDMTWYESLADRVFFVPKHPRFSICIWREVRTSKSPDMKSLRSATIRWLLVVNLESTGSNVQGWATAWSNYSR